MMNNALSHISFVCRLLVGFLFIYHGLVPKILWLNAIEIHLVSLSGLGVPADIASGLAGIGEIILGCLIIVSNKSIIPVYIAALVLVMLLLFVALASPHYLVAAFNPVTTNILGLGCCYLIVFISKHENR